MSRGRTSGVVAAGDPQTAAAGAEALLAGGTAVDAAVAAAFAAFVCEMPLCSPMGGGVLVAFGGGEAAALDLFARVPGLRASERSQLDFFDVTVDFGVTTQAFHVGRGSAALPAALPGLLQAHARFGRLPLAELVVPAVRLARDGYVLSPAVAYVFELLEPIARLSAGSRALFFAGDAIARAGACLRNPQLGSVLEALGRAPETVADLYAALARELGVAAGGLITEADVAALELSWSEPVHAQHRGFALHTMPAPSSGGTLVALGLRLLEGVRALPFLEHDHVEALVRVEELLLELRDPGFDARCRDAALVGALLSDPSVVALRARLGAAEVPGAPNLIGSTTHVSVLDDEGGMASLTLTNGEGSGHVLAGTGIHVNNLLGEEDINPRGFHAEPSGSAMATMMAPCLLVARDGRRMALGSGGSNRLKNAILTTLAHLVEHELSPHDAVQAPRLHVDLDASGRRTLAFERRGLGAAAQARLRALYPGAVEFAEPSMFFGGVHVAVSDANGFGGAGDARRGGCTRVIP